LFNQKRVGKKKALTDPVSIIPYKGQQERPQKNPKTSQNKESEQPERVPQQKEAKKLTNPTGKLDRRFLGIKDLYAESDQQNKANKEVARSDQPKNAFSIDELKMTWRKFAFEMRDKGMDTLFTALTTRDPELKEDYTIVHYVDNDVQLKFLQTNETQLLGHLKKTLKNGLIQLKIEEGSQDNGTKKLYSGKDKYEAMIERNPHLKTLRQKFKLDIDF